MKKYLQFIKESWSQEDYWFYAIHNNDIPKVKEMINNGIDINCQDSKKKSALIMSSFLGLKDLVELLLKQPGIDINLQDKDGYSALMYAFYFGNNYIIKILLKQTGIDINIKNKNGNSVLIIASSTDKKEIIKLLLKRPEIDINIKNNDNKNFIEILKDKYFLIDYDLHKKILKNGREDILIFLDKYELIHPKFKEENENIFKANNWGLI
jgi:ankyrin repeat protein